MADQAQTTTSMLDEELFPGVTLASLLGMLLRAPVQDIPTVEDYRRQQGELGVPTEAQSSREVGQDVLDWLTQAFGLAGILRGSAAGREQELMSKGRGIETFGKEMMETSRRAYPKKWERIQAEQWRPVDEPPSPVEPMMSGREGWGWNPSGGSMPPQAPIEGRQRQVQRWQQGRPPTDEVRLGNNEYHIGEMVELPGGAMAGYKVTPGPALGSFDVQLTYARNHPQGGAPVVRTFQVGAYDNLGEATAKARQLANRLALAAKDMVRLEADPTAPGARQFRFPWERSTSRGPEGPGQHGALWRYDYLPPPERGRWGE